MVGRSGGRAVLVSAVPLVGGRGRGRVVLPGGRGHLVVLVVVHARGHHRESRSAA